jgi:hypothetical protein
VKLSAVLPVVFVVSTYNHENGMFKLNPATMQFEELWQFHETLAKVLVVK